VELFKPLASVIPVFFLSAVGFVFAHWKKISLAPLAELIVYLGTPWLAFTSRAGKRFGGPVSDNCRRSAAPFCANLSLFVAFPRPRHSILLKSMNLLKLFSHYLMVWVLIFLTARGGFCESFERSGSSPRVAGGSWFLAR